jgi:hypothetical protein
VHEGELTVVPVVSTNQVRVHDHQIVRVTLDSGQVIEMSPRHPTADARRFKHLEVGDALFGATVLERELVAYDQPFTYDILPNSDTGAYFAGGALVGSTLKSVPAQVPEVCFGD